MNCIAQRIAGPFVFLLSIAAMSAAAVSTNVPLDHWSYEAVDKLADYGLIDSAMLTIRPLTRIEMARHVTCAAVSLGRIQSPPDVLEQIMDRLQQEFKAELIQIGARDGWYGGSFVKPVEDPYAKYVYATERPDLENMRGDVFRPHSNYRLGFATRGRLADTVAFYLHPEFSATSDDSDRDLILVEGYTKMMVGPVEIQVGKDSLWWGPARQGSILMSNNAAPFTMVKVTNPQPIQLPWILSVLGPFRAEWFLAELEDHRDPRDPNDPTTDRGGAKLSGIRVNIKPHPWVELGASRVVVFGGKGQPRVDFVDYGKMFFALSEQAENNQLAGFDASLRVPLGDNPLLRSVKLYVDAAGEDEAGNLPSKWGEIIGLQLSDLLRTGRTDLRIERADTHVASAPGSFYTHSLYTSGYTYKGRVIGHYVGTESRDVSVTLSHYLTGDILLDLTFDRQTHDATPEQKGTINIFQCDLTVFPSSDWRINAGYRYEDADGPAYDDNHIIQLQFIREF